jgi:hypothetical protein
MAIGILQISVKIRKKGKRSMENLNAYPPENIITSNNRNEIKAIRMALPKEEMGTTIRGK